MAFQPVRKAIFPVGGLGVRFLPATKAMPKEMLPIVDKPLIQYAVEEAVASGITHMVFITGRNKRAIEDHFDKADTDHSGSLSPKEFAATRVQRKPKATCACQPQDNQKGDDGNDGGQ